MCFIMELASIPLKKNGGYPSRNNFFTEDETFFDSLNKFCEKYNYTNVYASAYEYEDENVNDCNIIASPYFDFDADISNDDPIKREKEFQKVTREVRHCVNYFNQYLEIPIHQIQIYFSGHKGFHIIIPSVILGIEAEKDLNIKLKRLAEHLKRECKLKYLDLSIYDRRRLLRIPNTINAKSQLYKVPVTMEQLQGATYEWMAEWAAVPRSSDFEDPVYQKASARYFTMLNMIDEKAEASKNKKGPKEIRIPAKPVKLLPCAIQLLKDGARQGMRNRATVALTSSILQAGHTFEETYEVLEEWNQNNVPPLDSIELDTTINSAYNMILNGKGYGCSAYKDLGLCVEDCSLNKKG